MVIYTQRRATTYSLSPYLLNPCVAILLMVLSLPSIAQNERFEKRAQLLTDMAMQTIPAEFSNLEYRSKVLPNGIKVILLRNDATPEVLIEIYQQAGAADEWKTVSGIAHLHEHLMFKGDEHFEKISGHSKGVNAATSKDAVVYTETVRKDALESTLHTEADRYINFFTTLTDDILNTQKQVVRNEMLQRRGGLYGNFIDHILFELYKGKHPYSRPVIGFEEDFSAVDVQSLQTWHSFAYDPAKMIIVLNGDIEFDQSFALVQKYFGLIPSTKSKPSVVGKRKIGKKYLPDYIEMKHNIPGALFVASMLGEAPHEKSAISLDFLCEVFNQEIYNQLLLRIDNVTNAGCFSYQFLHSQPYFFYLELSKKGDAKEIFKKFRKVFSHFRDNPINNNLLVAIKGKFIGDLMRGFENKNVQSRLLAENSRLNLDRNVSSILKSYYEPTHASMVDAMRNALKKRVVLFYLEGDEQVVMPTVANSKKNYSGKPKRLKPWTNNTALPAVSEVPGMEKNWRYHTQNSTTHYLSNGIKVITSKPHDSHSLNSFMLINTPNMGRMFDPRDARGLNALTMSLVSTGGTSLFPPAQIEILSNTLGAETGSYANSFESGLYIKAPTHNLKPAMHLISHIFLEPKFDTLKFNNEVARIKHGLNNHKFSKSAINNLLYASLLPNDHPLGGLWAGSTNPTFLNTITTDRLKTWYAQRVLSAPIEIYISSSLPEAEMLAELEEIFSAINIDSDAKHQRKIPKAKQQNKGIKLFSLPSANQATITLGLVLNTPNYQRNPRQAGLTKLGIAAFGSDFLSRVNLSLREKKGWTYGARASIDYLYQMPILTITTSVDENYVHEAIAEITSLLNDIKGAKPFTEKEIIRVRRDLLFKHYTKSVDAQSLVSRLANQHWKNWNNKQQKAHWEQIAQASAKDVNQEIQQILTGTSQPLFIVAGNRDRLTKIFQQHNIDFEAISFAQFESN